MYFSLEHFEEDTAVLCDDNGDTVAVNRAQLPENAMVGELFVFKDGCYCRDENETAKRRERIRNLEQLLRNKQ